MRQPATSLAQVSPGGAPRFLLGDWPRGTPGVGFWLERFSWEVRADAGFDRVPAYIRMGLSASLGA